MPQVVLDVDEIMARERRDMCFICFGSPFDPGRGQGPHPARRRHFEWFAARGLRAEPTAPPGWLEGDAGWFAVHFAGPDDPRIAEYAAAFERPDGESLDPESYRMIVVRYQPWLAKKARGSTGEDGRADAADA